MDFSYTGNFIDREEFSWIMLMSETEESFHRYCWLHRQRRVFIDIVDFIDREEFFRDNEKLLMSHNFRKYDKFEIQIIFITIHI